MSQQERSTLSVTLCSIKADSGGKASRAVLGMYGDGKVRLALLQSLVSRRYYVTCIGRPGLRSEDASCCATAVNGMTDGSKPCNYVFAQTKNTSRHKAQQEFQGI